MFCCFDCGSPAFLIQGSCAWCEPELHRAFEATMKRLTVVEAKYFQQTGKRTFEDWYAFEHWVAATEMTP